ncbi:MAG: NADH-quinone oxidoreductase subunit M [Candidatus Kapabacteria bacterium]|nr:NADH-quinone oxidoreductase subunit M [Candidatus Kapabacteria bacterium]
MQYLFITLFLPLAGCLSVLFIDKEKKQLIKYFTLGISILTFLVSLSLFFGFNSDNPGFQYVYSGIWIRSVDAGFRVGIDGMSLLLVMLTTFLTPITILSSFEAIKKREKEYYALILLLQFAMVGVFVSLDLFLFYIFWELILIPMYFIIGIWGGKDKIYATVKFFIFTVVGSLFMLVAIVWLGVYVGKDMLHTSAGFTSNFELIRNYSMNIPLDIQKWLFLAFALSFCIKVPLFPFHTWLPDAHTEAPTPGSVILAGVLLKMGTYGLVRFNLDLFPQATIMFAPYISALAVIGIIYGALTAMVQTDIKRLVAYSSVSHLGFVVLGIFSLTVEGLQGGIIQMVNHGLSTGMLFMCVGVIYERRHTREISEFGGIARVMPAYTIIFALAMLASVGLPGLNGFVGEYLTLLGAFKSQFLGSWAYAIISGTGVIFAAVYLLWMFQRVMYGQNTNPKNFDLKDLNKTEWAMLVPSIIFIVWIGVYPATFMKVSEKSSEQLINKFEKIKFNRVPYQFNSQEIIK